MFVQIAFALVVVIIHSKFGLLLCSFFLHPALKVDLFFKRSLYVFKYYHLKPTVFSLDILSCIYSILRYRELYLPLMIDDYKYVYK